MFGRKKTPTGISDTAPNSQTETIDATGEMIVECPMPGTVLNIFVAPGQVVKSGETLLMIKAMKMKNRIVAQEAGVVSTVMVNKGSFVNRGDILVTLEQKLPPQGEPQFTLFC